MEGPPLKNLRSRTCFAGTVGDSLISFISHSFSSTEGVSHSRFSGNNNKLGCCTCLAKNLLQQSFYSPLPLTNSYSLYHGELGGYKPPNKLPLYKDEKGEPLGNIITLLLHSFLLFSIFSWLTIEGSSTGESLVSVDFPCRLLVEREPCQCPTDLQLGKSSTSSP